MIKEGEKNVIPLKLLTALLYCKFAKIPIPTAQWWPHKTAVRRVSQDRNPGGQEPGRTGTREDERSARLGSDLINKVHRLILFINDAAAVGGAWLRRRSDSLTRWA